MISDTFISIIIYFQLKKRAYVIILSLFYFESYLENLTKSSKQFKKCLLQSIVRSE